jgi:hypothetical protein
MRQVRVVDDPGVEQPVATTTAPAGAPVRETLNILLRIIGVAAGCVPLVVGLIAVARVDWSANGFSSPAVGVWNMRFSPWVAVATAVAGLIIVIAAATAYRTDKLVVGVLSAAAGFAILVAKPTVDHVVLARRYGLMFLVVGLVVVVVGLLIGMLWPRDRVNGSYVVD